MGQRRDAAQEEAKLPVRVEEGDCQGSRRALRQIVLDVGLRPAHRRRARLDMHARRERCHVSDAHEPRVVVRALASRCVRRRVDRRSDGAVWRAEASMHRRRERPAPSVFTSRP